MAETEIVPHTLSIEQCKKITATGIDSVDGFMPQQIVLTYAGGKITVTGNNLKIINFSKSTGAFAASGDISGVKYGAKSTKFLQKVFK